MAPEDTWVRDLLAALKLARPSMPEPSPLGEALTDRELAVLALLPTMLSNPQIAERLYVSVNTTKAHLKNLYRKLGVNGRREAVTRARELGLLP